MPDIKKSAIVPHSSAQMFELINKIEDYPQFIPFCKSTEVLSRDADEIRATLSFARGALEKSFSTINRLQQDKMIELRLLNGPFKHLQGFWLFEPLANHGCRVVLDLEFEFSNRFMGMAFEPFFTQIVNKLVDAFSKRADEVYGTIA